MTRPMTKTKAKTTRSPQVEGELTGSIQTHDDQLTEQFRSLRLPMFRDQFRQAADRAATEKLSHVEYLSELTTLECEAQSRGTDSATDDTIMSADGQDVGNRSSSIACRLE